jgi:hypothetical protein
MKAQLSLEYIILLLIRFISFAITLSLVIFLLTSSETILKRYQYLKEHHFVEQVALEVCVIGDGMKYTITNKYDHNISNDCGNIEIKAGKNIIYNSKGSLYVSVD